jgi:hypothetical protein
MLGNAKIEGLPPSLGMSGEQYNIALAIFFIPYVLAGTCFAITHTTALTAVKRFQATWF